MGVRSPLFRSRRDQEASRPLPEPRLFFFKVCHPIIRDDGSTKFSRPSSAVTYWQARRQP
jgi:hypothetical protein